MDQKSDFYITLPSNTVDPIFKNSPSNYRVKLANPIKLEGNWLVALMHIMYPHNWYNIRKDTEITFILSVREEDIEKNFPNLNIDSILIRRIYNRLVAIDPDIWKFRNTKYAKITIPRGYYESANILSKCIASEFNKYFGEFCKMSCEYDNAIEQVTLDSDRPLVFFFDHGEIPSSISLTGYELSPLANGESTLLYRTPCSTSKYVPALIHYQTPALYVYCDIVEHQFVGNAYEKLLREVPVKGRHGDIVEKEFKRPHYKPVSTGYISSIEIQISDDTGEKVPFQSGKTVCVIHLKKCGPSI